MAYAPIAIKRSRILGDLNDRCEALTDNVPVYLNDETGEPLGHIDESLGRYADAFVFHVPEDICKKLSTDSYQCGLNYDVIRSSGPGPKIKRYRLNSIVLKAKAEPKPLPQRMKATIVE
jgi:hypothetical protein